MPRVSQRKRLLRQLSYAMLYESIQRQHEQMMAFRIAIQQGEEPLDAYVQSLVFSGPQFGRASGIVYQWLSSLARGERVNYSRLLTDYLVHANRPSLAAYYAITAVNQSLERE